ncbi:MAG: DUF2341 domain-containing protein [Candidatus Eisenbacteria sp.]|nr:DUF2341 domain-containing protein [Candidatus Eisenbacteria bacterium]
MRAQHRNHGRSSWSVALPLGLLASVPNLRIRAKSPRCSILSLTSFLLMALLLLTPQVAYCWLDGWTYQRELTLDPATPADSFQTKVVLTPSNFDYSHALDDGADLRFTDASDNLQDFWISAWSVDDTSTIWVEVQASGTSTLYMYYGKASATAASDGDATFDFFDDFDGILSTSDYFASNALFIPFSRVSPPSIHNDNYTYVTYQGHAMDPYVVQYDHLSQEWTSPFQAGVNQLGNDDHGAPAIIRDATGHLHVFFGTHNTHIQHSKSAHPDDVTEWITQPDISCGGASYQQCVTLPNGDIYLFYRKFLEYGPGFWNRTLAYIISTDNGDTWTPPSVIVDFAGIDNWIYPGGIDTDGTLQIHVAWTYYNGTDRRGIYHAYLNLADSNMYGMDGVSLGTTISKAEADVHCFAVNCGNDNVYNPKVHIDADRTPYILFNHFGTNIEFTRWNGSSWTTPEIVIIGKSYDYIVHSPTDIEAYLVTDGHETLDKWTWDGAAWSFDSTVYERTASWIALPKIVLGGIDEFEVVFGEEEDDYTTPLKVYAYGDDGFVQSTSTEIDTSKWTGDTNHAFVDNSILTYDGGEDATWYFIDGISDGILQNFAAPIVVEFNAIMHTSGGTRRDAEIGLRNFASSRYAHIYRQGANNYNWYSTRETAWEEGPGNFSYDVWTHFKMAWKTDAVDFYYKDASSGSLEAPDATHTAQVPTVEMNPFLGSRWGAMQCDWYLARKHAEHEPVISVGEENTAATVDEHLPGTHRPEIILYHNSANPVFGTSGARISYALLKPDHVSLRIYDVSGQLIATLVNGTQQAGDHTVLWNPEPDLRSGKYFYRIIAGNAAANGQCVIFR